MRHNQNARRMRGGRGNGHNSGHHHNGRRVNPRVQTFDSNGPDVRIRGTAYQINEKYVTLARDATSAGDRVLAESYLQHAEHYQRFINEMTEEQNQNQQQNQQNSQNQPQPSSNGKSSAATDESLNDLDQGFLVGPRKGNGKDSGNGKDNSKDGNGVDAAPVEESGEAPKAQDGQRSRRASRRSSETGAV